MKCAFFQCLGTRVLCGVGLLASLGSLAAEAPSPKTRQSGILLGKGRELPLIELTAPQGGWTVDRMVEISGTVSDPTIDPITVNLNGERYLLRTTKRRPRSGKGEDDASREPVRFSRKFPAQPGRNIVSVSGSNLGGTGRASASFFSKISPVALSAILTSDTDGVYTDLHIYEPDSEAADPYGLKVKREHVYWARTESPTGGKFYLNEQSGSFDQPGYGPYLYTHTAPPIGIFRIDANYWPSGDKAHTLATLNLTLFGGTSNEVKRLARQPLVTPGETVTLAFVRIDRGGTGAIYVPGLDPRPKDTKLWPQWVLDHPTSRSGEKTGDPFTGMISEGGQSGSEGTE
jgi:hypothetical protein